MTPYSASPPVIGVSETAPPSKPCSRAALAYLSRASRHRPAASAAGRLLYLLRSGLVVVPARRLDGGWSCIVIADPAGSRLSGRLTVTDIEIETALSVRTLDPVAELDASTYAQIWQIRVWERWPGGHMPQLARVLAEDLLQPPTLIVDLDHDAVRRILRQVHLRPVGLRQLLDRLHEAGLLVAVSPCQGESWGSWALAIPNTSCPTNGATKACGHRDQPTP